ncbi:MAG TPA: hypothetical protein VK553_06625 [Candidatus Nitrosopolaris rasttigaisensis]|jgi:hypothetical protein|nr:hypothetical protein [Candidatus Nitrosopolaris rasttigaisensis]
MITIHVFNHQSAHPTDSPPSNEPDPNEESTCFLSFSASDSLTVNDKGWSNLQQRIGTFLFQQVKEVKIYINTLITANYILDIKRDQPFTQLQKE